MKNSNLLRSPSNENIIIVHNFSFARPNRYNVPLINNRFVHNLFKDPSRRGCSINIDPSRTLNNGTTNASSWYACLHRFLRESIAFPRVPWSRNAFPPCWPRVKGDFSKEEEGTKVGILSCLILEIFDPCLKKKEREKRNEEFVGGRIKGGCRAMSGKSGGKKEARRDGCAQTGRRPRPLRELHFNRSLY